MYSEQPDTHRIQRSSCEGRLNRLLQHHLNLQSFFDEMFDSISHLDYVHRYGRQIHRVNGVFVELKDPKYRQSFENWVNQIHPNFRLKCSSHTLSIFHYDVVHL